MEPFEWLMLGVGLVIGGLFGSRGKNAVKSAAKGYLVVGEKAKEWTSNIREDLRDAIEEARYEREQEEAERERTEFEAAHADSAVHVKSNDTHAKSTRKASADAEHAHEGKSAA